MAGSARRPARFKRSTRPAPRARAAVPWYDSPWRIIGHAVSAALTIVSVAILVAVVVVPRITGGTSLTVLTGSMEPTLRPGDVIVTRGTTPERVCSDVSIGTIVTYLPTPNDPTLITHRVVGKTIGTFDDGTSCRLITQGDNNSAADEPVSPEQVRGVFMFGLPKLGWARQWVGGNVQAMLIAGAVAAIAYGVWTSTRKPNTRIVPLPSPEGPEQFALDRELRARELDLREREIDLRSQELELARRRAGLIDEALPIDGAPIDDEPPANDKAPEPSDVVAAQSSSALNSSEA